MSFATSLAYNVGDTPSFLSHSIRQHENTPGPLEQEGAGDEKSEEGFRIQTGGSEGLGRCVEESKGRTGGEDVGQEDKVAECAGYSPPDKWQEDQPHGGGVTQHCRWGMCSSDIK